MSSDYRVYIKNGISNVEIEIPEIYRDPNSETNTDQIKTYLCNTIDIDYDNLFVDIKRNRGIKRKCNSSEVENGDELYFYYQNNKKIDYSKINLKSGSSSAFNAKFNNYNFLESDLKMIVTKEDDHFEKIEIIINDINNFLTRIQNSDDIEFIRSLTIISFIKDHLYQLPFTIIDNFWYFGNLNSNRKPTGYGYIYDPLKKSYYEGEFSDFIISGGKSLIMSEDAYYSKCYFYMNFKQTDKGSRKYLFRNELYIGKFSEDKYENDGILINDSGKYIGFFKDHLIDSYGIMIYSNGDIYSGYWHNGKRNIFGKIKYKNGNYYSGIWCEDKFDEFGIYYNNKYRITYIGTFKDNKCTFNKDEFKLIDNHLFYSDYIGERINNLEIKDDEIKHILSEKIYDKNLLLTSINKNKVLNSKSDFNQNHYIGHYDYTKRFYGIGMLFHNSENVISKNYEDILKYSKEYYENKYKGYRSYYSLFLDGIPNVFGMINYENGDKYIGNIKNGKLNGIGTFIKNNGERIKAFWDNNRKIHNIN